jgi:hypothetical protein
VLGHCGGVRCDTTAELDMMTLIWTRGEMTSLDLLADRLRRPICGNRKIQVYFEVPAPSCAGGWAHQTSSYKITRDLLDTGRRTMGRWNRHETVFNDD